MIVNPYSTNVPQPVFNAQKMLDYSRSLTNANPGAFGYTPDFNTVSQQSFENPPSMNNLAGGIQAGTQLAAMGTSMIPTDSNPYTTSGAGVLKGFTQGAQMGAQFGGPLGAAVGAIGGIVAGGVKEVIGQRNALKNADSTVDAMSMSATGQPVYMGGNVNNAIGEMEQVEDSRKKGDVFNRKLKRNTQNRLASGIQAAQTDFNTASQSFNQEQVARDQYRQRRDMTNRVYNLYSI